MALQRLPSHPQDQCQVTLTLSLEGLPAPACCRVLDLDCIFLSPGGDSQFCGGPLASQNLVSAKATFLDTRPHVGAAGSPVYADGETLGPGLWGN